MAHRLFADRPTTIFCDDVTNFVKKTGTPEEHPDLYRGRLPKDVHYIILRHVTIDGTKRPNGDMAPCPMCTPNRFLVGDLVYVPSMKVAAVIGRCCANNARQAERQFQLDEQKRYEEDYLLQALPRLAPKREEILRARSVAERVQKIYRTLRREMPHLQARLRAIKDRANARLVLHEIIRGGEDEQPRDYFGPSGIRGRGGSAIETRDIDFGFLAGTTATIRDYRPVMELNDVHRNLSLLDFGGDEEAAIDFIARMTDAERRATLASLQLADKNFERFVARARDCLSFFADDNIERLNKFGTHPLNSQQFSMTLEMTGKRRFVRFKEGNLSCRIHIDVAISEINFSWEFVPARKP